MLIKVKISMAPEHPLQTTPDLGQHDGRCLSKLKWLGVRVFVKRQAAIVATPTAFWAMPWLRLCPGYGDDGRSTMGLRVFGCAWGFYACTP